ncbi:rhodanese-like domain-containing protein [Erythrobacter alti]|uniref:rhodanese-like domain-containing protein n=1 Tax=Erythrobacter alti TaxID=1896145 RepID=UPI0030F4AC44
MRALLIASAVMALAACSDESGLPLPEAMTVETADATSDPAAAVETLDSGELSDMIARGEVVLIDVRTPEEFAAGRLPVALNAPVDTFDAASIPIEGGRETILYCRSGNRSGRAAQMLAEHTGTTVRHLEGGITAWQDTGGDVIGAETPVQ